ncbi:MAG: hypothetical protein ACKO22_13230 [Cyanobium sp.]
MTTLPDLSTTWLGLPLRSPLVVGAAAPLSEDLDDLLRLEEAGAAAVVLHSLFEEQIEHDQLELWRVAMQGSDSYGEALSYFPEPSIFHVGHDLYLRHLEQARARLSIPVIFSLNGFRPGSWVRFARHLEEAGASAIELNIYSLPADPNVSSAAIETQVEEIVAEVRAEVRLPLAVKLGPFFTNFGAIAHRLTAAGADGLTLFNRLYQPDIDIEELEVRPQPAALHPSRPAPAVALDRPAPWPPRGRPGRYRRRAPRQRRGAPADGRRLIRPGGGGAAAPRTLPAGRPGGGAGQLAAGARSRHRPRADRLHEPGALPRPGGIRAGPVHARHPDLPPGRCHPLAQRMRGPLRRPSAERAVGSAYA